MVSHQARLFHARQRTAGELVSRVLLVTLPSRLFLVDSAVYFLVDKRCNCWYRVTAVPSGADVQRCNCCTAVRALRSGAAGFAAIFSALLPLQEPSNIFLLESCSLSVTSAPPKVVCSCLCERARGAQCLPPIYVSTCRYTFTYI